jgi:orotate phosphoribosyltransferase
MNGEVLSLVRGRRGHFAYESGHHGDVWFDLETLCQRPHILQPFTAQLAARLKPFLPDAVCGPLVEGAFIGLLVASELPCDFTYASRFAPSSSDALFPVEYRLPPALYPLVSGRRVAIVNDVINAGSAVRGTLRDLQSHGATVVAVASLVILGDAFADFAAEQKIPVESLAHLPNNLWTPAECPQCAAGMALEHLAIS